MQSCICKNCKYCAWMVGIGMGVQCKHPDNQKYKPKDASHQNRSVIISHIPKGCDYFQREEKN